MTMLNRIAGVPVACTSPPDAVAQLESWTRGRPIGHDVHLVNAWTVALADGDDAYMSMLNDASINFPDGYSVVWASKRSSLPLQQVRGPALFRDALASTDSDLRHFLLGGDEDTLARLQDEIRRQYPGARVVGAYSPPFRELAPGEYADQDRLIAASGANIVWVGLGTPKQDYEAQRLARALPVVAVAVGAAFDFVAGTKAEAPVWVRGLHAEWAFRLLTEPRRLWRRYLIGNFRFLAAVRRRHMQPVLAGALEHR